MAAAWCWNYQVIGIWPVTCSPELVPLFGRGLFLTGLMSKAQ